MQALLVIISLALLGGIVHFMISPKSSRLLRISAIIALIFIGLAVGVCGVLLLRGPTKVETAVPFQFLLDAEQPKPQNRINIGVIIGYFAVFAIIFALVAYSSKKEKQKKDEPEKKAVKNQGFQSADENDLDLGNESEPVDDDSFDIGIE